jgi:hypothetical protein
MPPYTIFAGDGSEVSAWPRAPGESRALRFWRRSLAERWAGTVTEDFRMTD